MYPVAFQEYIELTRINILDPSLLADQHLVAEYRETPMVPAALKRTLRSVRGYSNDRIPKRFTLNAGHVTFFYNKLGYLQNRYNQLIVEMKARGMQPDPSRVLNFDGIPQHCFGDWTPAADEQKIVIERIAMRLRQKPTWYRYRGSAADVEQLITQMVNRTQKGA